MIRKLLFAMPLVIALGACGSDADNGSGDAAGDDASARGEVLGGTISDDMIPLDQLKSRSAPLKQSTSATDTGGDDTTQGEPAEEAAPAEETAPAAEDTAPELPEN